MGSRKDILFGWIEACIRYGGAFGPAEKVSYQQVFGLSEPSVSRHQAEFETLFQDACGDVFERDDNQRLRGGRLVLRATANLRNEPVFPKMPDLTRWLQENLGGSGYVEEDIRRQDPPPWILRPVIQSIRSRTRLGMTYHSRRAVGEKVVSPHAIIRIVGRLHMRAFDHGRNDFFDFVLARITRASPISDGSAYVGPAQDIVWTTFTKVVIEEKGLTRDETTRTGVRLDFGLDEDGQRTVSVRQSLVRYLIDDMGEDFSAPVRVFARDGQ